MTALRLSHIVKRYQTATVVDDLSISVEKGEFLCLLGPSGCGKTTTLRVIAGFESIDSGEVLLDGVDITNMPPQRRDIGFVFQQYALFPHLTVAENVSFGLKMRHRPRAEIDQAVREALALVRLSQMGERLPRQLSGGQQQRVALARALAIRPHLLLMDEPLSNLDAQLRDEMRDEIRRIQNTTGITAIFVTHDQSEALALADRVAVMAEGKILQLDSPLSIYETPQSKFVGSFIGQANILRGTIKGAAGPFVEITTEKGVPLFGACKDAQPASVATILIKKERVTISRNAPAQTQNAFASEVEDLTYLGHTISYRCRLADGPIDAMVPNHPMFEKFEKGDKVFVHWSPADCRVFPH